MVCELSELEQALSRQVMPVSVAIAFLLISSAVVSAAEPSSTSLRVVVAPVGEAQSAPHGQGNVYAPDVLLDNGLYRMWFGGQGKDGHDRLQLAESRDGLAWQSRGVVLDNGDANHINDPSVVKVGGKYFMYYTRAASDVVDEIALATSADGVRWTPHGVVLRPSSAGNWDSLLVGRPSVLIKDGVYRMWYDGRKDLPPGAPAKDVPKSPASTRAVGYATSQDGYHWTRLTTEPVFRGDAGGVHVARVRNGYAMVYEGHDGTHLATSTDGLSWQSKGLLTASSGTDADRFGHVTPFLLTDSATTPIALFVGAARAGSWDHNSIARIELSESQLRAFNNLSRKGAKNAK